MNSAPSWSRDADWREFLDLLSDAVVVVDAEARVVLANTEALRLLPCETGASIDQWHGLLGADTVDWLKQAVVRRGAPQAPLKRVLLDGRGLTLAWRRLDEKHAALHLALSPAASPSPMLQAAGQASSSSRHDDILAFLWDSPFPTVLQRADLRIADINQAFVDFLGFTPSQVIGRDPIDMLAPEDRPAAALFRTRLHADPAAEMSTPSEGRMLDSSGRERHYRVARRLEFEAGGQTHYLAVLQDTTAERVARDNADRSMRELDDWFDLSPTGMVLFDDRGLFVRTNPAFDVLAGTAPVSMSDAPASLRELLGWDGAAASPGLEAGAPPVQRQGFVSTSADDTPRPMRAILRCYLTVSHQRRTMAVIEDRSAVAEQHLAQLRTDELLRELSTILESTSAGIAYLRGNVLVRCNRRFEVMLGLEGNSLAGRRLEELLGANEHAERLVADAWQALGEGVIYETEFDLEVPRPGGTETRWYSLSVRRAGAPSGLIEAIAALSDVTRLKAQQREFEILARDRELMFSLSEVGIAFVRGGSIQRANEALAQLSGYTVAELSTLALPALFNDADAFAELWPDVDRSMREAGRWSGERHLRRRDGRLLRVQVSKRLVSAGDRSGGIIASYVNVDARWRAERAVALQADRTRSILDSVLVGIVTVGPRGIEWMNRSASRMFSADLADLVERPIASVATPEPDHPFRRTEYLTELVEGAAETFECRVQARDGRRFWVAGNVVSTARESEGRQLTYALLDIERRREAEARMSQAQSQLQRIIEAAPLAITLLDARSLKILQANGVAASSVHTTPTALIGRTPEQLFDAETAAQRRADMLQALASVDVTTREYRVERDGESHIWDARYLPLSERAGQAPDRLLLVATDVTEQRVAAQARFDAAIAQREMLVKEVHHRIKNNLQGVAGLLQQIGQRKPEVAGPISEVVSQVQAIAHVYGLQVGESGPLQLESVVTAIAASVQRTFGCTIGVATSGTSPGQWLLPEAESIPIALTLNELLTNAVKHHTMGADGAAPGCEVHCALASSESGVEISIANVGRLPGDFNLARIRGSVSGLGLVRALLPRRSAKFTLEQHADQVVATVALQSPGVIRIAGV